MKLFMPNCRPQIRECSLIVYRVSVLSVFVQESTFSLLQGSRKDSSTMKLQSIFILLAACNEMQAKDILRNPFHGSSDLMNDADDFTERHVQRMKSRDFPTFLQHDLIKGGSHEDAPRRHLEMSSVVQTPSSSWNVSSGRNHGRSSSQKKRRLYGATIRGWRNLRTNRAVAEEVIVDPLGERMLQASPALDVCGQAVVQEQEAGSAYGTVCTCTPNTIQRTAKLMCTDMTCGYCNEEETVCERYSYGVVFDEDGQDVEFFEQDEYISGKEGTLKYTEKDGGCSVSVDNKECSSCTMEDCNDDGWYGINVQCTNIPHGASFSSCSEGFRTEGIFEAYNEDEFGYCFTSFDACERDTESIDPKYDCFCDEDVLKEEGYTLRCVDKCEYCNVKTGVCGKENYEQIYEHAMFAGTKKTVVYTAGRGGEVIYEASNCDVSGCKDCRFEVDGVQCNQCTLQTCSNGESAPLLDCENIESGATIDFCQEETIEHSVFEYFSSGFTDQCTSKGELACLEAKAQYESSDQAFICKCGGSPTGNTELTCESTCGDLCNDETSVCVRESFAKDFIETGEASYFRKDMQYSMGRKGMISYWEYMDGICSMSVDHVTCDSCVIQTCTGNDSTSQAPLLDCSNIDSGAILDLCDATLKVEDGIFERFSIEEFQECVDRTPSNGVCGTAQDLPDLPFSASGSTMMVAFDGSESCGHVSFSPGLWYTIIGSGAGIQASTCQDEADFSTQISIYSGDCDDQSCMAGSETNCEVAWFGKEGVSYQIRVHGVGFETGNFGLQVKEVNFAETECESMADVFEANPYLVGTCECGSPDDDGHVRLSCAISCSLCNEDGDVCGDESHIWEINRYGAVVSIEETFQYTMVREEEVVMKKTKCSDASTCEECQVEVDGVACDQCQIVSCEGDTDTKQGIVASCENINAHLNVSTCETSGASDDVLQVMKDNTFGTCFDRDASAACFDHKEYEENADENVICDCKEVGVNGDIQLVCKNQDCLLCNSNNALCGYKAFGSTFGNELGRVVSKFTGFQYVEGRDDLVAFHEYMGNSKEPNECLVTVNEEECSECISIDCDDPGKNAFMGRSFDCENVLDGISFDGCGTNATVEGVFEFLVQSEFTECTPVRDPFETCQTTREESIAVEPSLETSCTCEKLVDGGYEMACSDAVDCQYCDRSKSLCADYSQYSAYINRFGSFVSYSDTFDYISGRNETIVIKDDRSDCTVTIDGVACSKCEIVECPTKETSDSDPGTTYAIDCSNVLEREATYACGEGDEIFAAISNSLYYMCEGDTESPSSIPSDFPSVAPSTVTTTQPTSANDNFNFTMGIGTSGGQAFRLSTSAFSALIASLWMFL
jgi:hypothetical protein